MIEVLERTTCVLAQLHGLRRRRILVRHALPNAVGPDDPGDGAEPRLPRGWGRRGRVGLLVSGHRHARCAGGRQPRHPGDPGAVVLLAAFYVLVNLLADIGVILVTPRLRVNARGAPRRPGCRSRRTRPRSRSSDVTAIQAMIEPAKLRRSLGVAALEAHAGRARSVGLVVLRLALIGPFVAPRVQRLHRAPCEARRRTLRSAPTTSATTCGAGFWPARQNCSLLAVLATVLRSIGTVGRPLAGYLARRARRRAHARHGPHPRVPADHPRAGVVSLGGARAG